jgi:hypothetical protein
MKESAFSDKVVQKLNEFERMQNIQPSAGWNESLLNKIASAKSGSASNLPSAGFAIPVLFIVLVNIVLFLNIIIDNSYQGSYKDNELQVISEELLINPISIKN